MPDARSKNSKWLKQIAVAPLADHSFEATFDPLILVAAIHDGLVMHTVDRHGYLVSGKDIDREIIALGYRLIVRKEDRHGRRRRRKGGKLKLVRSLLQPRSSTYLRTNPLGCIRVAPDYDDNECLNLKASVHGEPAAMEIIALADRLFRSLARDKGAVHMLVRDSRGGLDLRRSREVGVPFERGNYGGPIQAMFDRAVRELAAKTPTGRFLLLDGQPGTGKTFFVRGLIHATRSTCAFVVVPTKSADALADPELLPMLLDAARERWPDRKTILLIEDADGAILPRGSDNHNAIAALLNLSDGIIGDASDVRVIATTNAPRVEVDKALLRPGRLLGHVTVPLLGADEATAVARRLAKETSSGSSRLAKKPFVERLTYSLAEVYEWSRRAP